LVIFPTETLYGLGAISTDRAALAKLVRAKKRPKEKGFIVLIARKADLRQLAESVPKTAKVLIDAFWPGPLTLVFTKKSTISNRLTGSDHTIAIRYTSHPVAQKLIRKAGKPITAPSANISGNPAPRTAYEALEDLGANADIAYALDAGRSPNAKPSTIVDVSGTHIKILREGAVPKKRILAALRKAHA
jgi:L-threonylcarbamoyladenylate synthase